MDDETRDSLGSLSLPKCSEEPTLERGPSAQTVEHVSSQLLRLSAIFGQPWRDKLLMQQMCVEWARALADVAPDSVEREVSRWIREKTKWPTVADIRAGATAPPPEAPRAVFAPLRSALRADPRWAAFLNTLEPWVESHWFGNASGAGSRITVASHFERDTIDQRWGDELARRVGPLTISVERNENQAPA